MLSTDPVTLKLDANGNLNVAALATRGLAAFDSGLTSVVTGVRTRILLIAGEWFLNLDAGVPWYARDGVDPATVILGSKYDEARIRPSILRAILSTPGVLEVTQLRIEFEPALRNVVITWQARTVFGDTDPDTLAVTG
jgi:hypothetical protein